MPPHLVPAVPQRHQPAEVKGTKEITFSTVGAPGGGDVRQHTINHKKFDGEVGALVLLNTVEEWKIVNETYAADHLPSVPHPHQPVPGDRGLRSERTLSTPPAPEP